jgi:hypothetical protein
MPLPAELTLWTQGAWAAAAPVRLLLFLLLGLLGAWLVLRYLQVQAARIAEAWQALAAELDFAYRPSRGPAFRRKSDEVEGMVQGVPVRLSRYGLSPGLDSAIYTRWSAELEPPPDFVLYVHSRHALARVAAMLGYEDLEVGDPTFDRRWSTKSDEPGRVRQILNPEVRSKIDRLNSAAIVVNDTGINVVWPGPIADATELKNGLDALRAILAALRPETSGDRPDGPTLRGDAPDSTTRD